MTYGTTSVFLEYFGLRSLDDLPAADELRRIPIDKPQSLATVDPGLATAPPEQLMLTETGQLAPAPSERGTPPAPPETSGPPKSDGAEQSAGG